MLLRPKDLHPLCHKDGPLDGDNTGYPSPFETLLQFLQSFCNHFTSPLRFAESRTGPTD